MAGIGLGFSVAAEGWKGIIIFGAALLGAYVGAMVGNSILVGGGRSTSTGQGGTGKTSESVDDITPDEQWENPTGQAIRGEDLKGKGAFMAPREGGGGHAGIDLISDPGQEVKAPFGGELTKGRYNGLPTATIRGERFTGRLLYLQSVGVESGSAVLQGQVIGTAGDISPIYGLEMTNHVHFQVKFNLTQKFVDPTNWIFP